MGIAYRIDHVLGFTLVVWHGDVTAQDAKEHLVQLAADSQWPPGRLLLTDISTVGRVTLPDPELLELLLEGTDLRERLEKVVVVPPAFLRGNGIEKAAASLGMKAKPFGDLDAACDHLGVDPASVRTVTDELRREIEHQELRIDDALEAD
jgi:hypothetical protein